MNLLTRVSLLTALLAVPLSAQTGGGWCSQTNMGCLGCTDTYVYCYSCHDPDSWIPGSSCLPNGPGCWGCSGMGGNSATAKRVTITLATHKALAKPILRREEAITDAGRRMIATVFGVAELQKLLSPNQPTITEVVRNFGTSPQHAAIVAAARKGCPSLSARK